MGHIGSDTLVGKGGNDFIEALDGQRDKVDCGGGSGDDAAADPKDSVSSC